MLFFQNRKRSTDQSRPAPKACLIESLENRALFSASLKVISLTPPVKHTPVVHVKAPKAPKAVKVGNAAKKTPVTLSSAGGERHVDYGTSQFGV